MTIQDCTLANAANLEPSKTFAIVRFMDVRCYVPGGSPGERLQPEPDPPTDAANLGRWGVVVEQ